MIENTPIKNINNPPYFFRIRGKYFMECILICSAILLGGIMCILTFVILDLFWFGMLILGSSIVSILLVYLYYIHKSKSTPFKDIKKTADMISHINFNEYIE